MPLYIRDCRSIYFFSCHKSCLFLNTAAGSILDRYGASRNILDGLSNARPITESDEGNILVLAPSDEIYRVSAFACILKQLHEVIVVRTLISLGEQQVGFLCGREIGNAITSVEHYRSFR